jgi:hypothetical protein
MVSVGRPDKLRIRRIRLLKFNGLRGPELRMKTVEGVRSKSVLATSRVPIFNFMESSHV